MLAHQHFQITQGTSKGRETSGVLYIDETWFTTRMHPSREWVGTSQSDTSDSYSRQVPPGERVRFVVVVAGTVNGFIEDCFLFSLPKTKVVTTMER